MTPSKTLPGPDEVVMVARLRPAEDRHRRSTSCAVVLALITALALISTPAQADPSPYPLPGRVPAQGASPAIDPRAPFTPTVRRILGQLLPAQPDPVNDTRPALGTTLAQLRNAALILHGTEASQNPASQPGFCPGVAGAGGDAGGVRAPAGTRPAVSQMCWVDAMGVGVGSGAQVRRTTAQPHRLALGSTWDPRLVNAWGQVEGEEGRRVGVTGIYAPQTDLMRIPNWGRNLSTYGEDPFHQGILGAAEINGIQSKGLMAQPKHFALYHGGVFAQNTRIQDQAAQQLLLAPFEYLTSGSGLLPRPGLASSLMCSYQVFEIIAAPRVPGTPPEALGPPGGTRACNHPLKDQIARDQWGWEGFIGTDYRLGMDQTIGAITSGTDQEMPTDLFFGDQLVLSVVSGAVPLNVFTRSIARILYQQERFGLLGHPRGDSDFLSPSSPIDIDSPVAITPAEKARHGAVTERLAEQGAVLLKNKRETLPLSGTDLTSRRGVLVLGLGAEYLVSMPAAEASTGFPDRNAVSPLQQLRQFAPRGANIQYVPWVPGAGATPGTGIVVKPRSLSPRASGRTGGLRRIAGPGARRVDRRIDFTARSRQGHLRLGSRYAWKGYVKVPRQDDHTLRIQFSAADLTEVSGGAGVPVVPGAPPLGGGPSGDPCNDEGAPVLRLAPDSGSGAEAERLELATSGPTEANIGTALTMSGYTERGLVNCLVNVGDMEPGRYLIGLGWTTPRRLGDDFYGLREPGVRRPSLRLAWSRAAADERIVRKAAKRARKVVVFAGTGNNLVDAITPTEPLKGLDAARLETIRVAGSANPRTSVVLNTDNPIEMPWVDDVDSVLQMWFAGSEGGTATARLLLGRAAPSGRLPFTWPADGTQTLYTHDEQVPNYTGATTGVHPNRLDVAPVTFDEGIFIGYRWFDRQDLTPRYRFGHGLTYTSFDYTQAKKQLRAGGYDVTVKVTNTGRRRGVALPQVYVGPAASVPAGVQQAERSLGGFARVPLRPGQSKRITIRVGPGRDLDGYGNKRAFDHWSSPDQAWVTPAQVREIWVGESAGPSLIRAVTTAADRAPTEENR